MDWLTANLDFFVLLINLFFVAAGIVTAVIMAKALRRFEKGELYSTIRYFSAGVIFTVLYKVIEVINEYTSFAPYWLFLFSHIALLIAIVLVFFAGIYVIRYTNPSLKTPRD